METLKKIGRAMLVLSVVLAALVIWKREELVRLNAVNTLFEPELIVHNFSHMDQLFLTRAMELEAGPPVPLPKAEQPMPEGFDQWIAARHVTAVVALKDGRIAAERYLFETGRDDLRVSWSMAKSFLSALLGIVIAEGDIPSIEAQVTDYVPELKESAYAGATIRDVLQMSSGVAFNEDYFDFWSDINKMGRVLALGASMDEYAADLTETRAGPGEDWHYVSIDTHVIGMVIRRATGRDIPDLLTEKILKPMGLRGGAYYITDGEGVAFVLGGLNMTTRDYARFGQMILDGGRYNDRQIVPADWLEVSTTPSAPTADGETRYGYQWWIEPDAPEGEVFARGIYGQYIYINRPAGVVIAVNAADREFREPGVHAENIAMFRAIAETLAAGGSGD